MSHNNKNLEVHYQNKYSRFYPWLVWGLAAIFLFYKYLIEVSPSVMTSEFMRFFSIDGAKMGNLAACYFYAYCIMQLPMGLLMDRFGPRRVATSAILLCSSGIILLAQSKLLLTAEAARFLTGVGASAAVLSCFKLVSLWFPQRKFAFVAGLAVSIGMLGAVNGQAPLSLVISVAGWQHTLFYGGLFGVVFGCFFWILVRDKNQDDKSKVILNTRASFWAGLIAILKNKQTWLLSIYSGLAFAPVSVFGGLWGVPFLQANYGLSSTVSAEAVSLVFVGFALGCPLAGWLSNRFNNRVMIMGVGTSLALMASLIVIYSTSLSPFAIDALLFSFGFFISSFFLCFPMICEVNHLLFAATAIGFMNTFDAALGAVSDPMMGRILDLGWNGKMIHGARIFSVHNYHFAMALIPLYLIIAMALLPFLKETYGRQQL